MHFPVQRDIEESMKDADFTVKTFVFFRSMRNKFPVNLVLILVNNNDNNNNNNNNNNVNFSIFYLLIIKEVLPRKE